ncbi:MAG TPA: hypothetical protein VHB48_10055, partial [Chitinophagaceae bacterium]|nr:hypothetical protein [Chitinophagaceae bacterium]
MSFSIKSTPGSYYSAHGDLIWVVYQSGLPADTDHSTYPDYKYVAYVIIGGSIVARVAVVPQPGTYFGVFNLGDIIRNYVTSVFNPSASAVAAQQTGANEFFVNVTAAFNEEYGGNEYPVANPDPANTGDFILIDSQRTFFNHYNGRMAGVTTSLAAFTDKVATNRPVQNFINSGDAYSFLPYFPTSTTGIAIQVKAYAGTTLQGTYNGTITPGAAYNLQILNVAPNAINAASTGLINANTTYYTVQLNGGVVYTFTLTCEGVHTSFTLHFLNQYGGFESRNFTKLSRKSIAITKTNFGKLPYSIDSSGNVNYYNSAAKVYNE